MIRVREDYSFTDDGEIIMQEYKVIWTFNNGSTGKKTWYSQESAEEEVNKRKEMFGDDLKDITIKKGRKFIHKNGKQIYI